MLSPVTFEQPATGTPFYTQSIKRGETSCLARQTKKIGQRERTPINRILDALPVAKQIPTKVATINISRLEGDH